MQLQSIQKKIYELRGLKVMPDYNLAELYEVETRVLKQAVRRNIDVSLRILCFSFQLMKLNRWYHKM